MAQGMKWILKAAFVLLFYLSSPAFFWSPHPEKPRRPLLCALSQGREERGSCLASLQLRLCSLLGLWWELALSVAEPISNFSFPHSPEGREAYGLFVGNLLGKVPCDLAVYFVAGYTMQSCSGLKAD